jgi:hypothetical protein
MDLPGPNVDVHMVEDQILPDPGEALADPLALQEDLPPQVSLLPSYS